MIMIAPEPEDKTPDKPVSISAKRALQILEETGLALEHRQHLSGGHVIANHARYDLRHNRISDGRIEFWIPDWTRRELAERGFIESDGTISQAGRAFLRSR